VAEVADVIVIPLAPARCCSAGVESWRIVAVIVVGQKERYIVRHFQPRLVEIASTFLIRGERLRHFGLHRG